MSLLALQREFPHFLQGDPSAVSDAISGDAASGLAVYHNAYRGQLVACLRDGHERLWAWLGDDAFDAAARRHIAAHAPESWTLNDYGSNFPQTIRALYPDDPEVVEIATLDRALRHAFDGPDAVAFDPQRLAAVDWNSAAISFVPTLEVIPATTNCGAIWSAIAAGEAVPGAETLPEPGYVRVWRVGPQPHFASIEAAEMKAIQLMASGLSFARPCDRLSEEAGVEIAVETASRYLASWVQDELISDIG